MVNFLVPVLRKLRDNFFENLQYYEDPSLNGLPPIQPEKIMVDEVSTEPAPAPLAPSETYTAKVVRDTSTGRFVRKEMAKTDPRGTVEQTIHHVRKRKPT